MVYFTGSMSYQSLMKQKGAVVGAWPDTTKGVGRALLNHLQKVQVAKGWVHSWKIVIAGRLMIKEPEFQLQSQAIHLLSVPKSDKELKDQNIISMLPLFCHPMVHVLHYVVVTCYNMIENEVDYRGFWILCSCVRVIYAFYTDNPSSMESSIVSMFISIIPYELVDC